MNTWNLLHKCFACFEAWGHGNIFIFKEYLLTYMLEKLN